tara:strand:- start:488 stop:946 length:459 start_codon:yes stop_codon:yes gene_type:complete
MVAPTGTEKIPSNCKTAAAVCIFYNGSVCLGRRADRDQKGNLYPYSGYWSAFGGEVEEGENPMVAACRELKEETGVNLDILDLTYMEQVTNEDGCIYILYAHHLKKLIFPTLNFEHSECGYFKIDYLQNSPNPICPKMVNAIVRYEERRWKG